MNKINTYTKNKTKVHENKLNNGVLWINLYSTIRLANHKLQRILADNDLKLKIKELLHILKPTLNKQLNYQSDYDKNATYPGVSTV